MNLALDLGASVEFLRPHLLATALAAARIAPATFLCPLFGGMAAPNSVRVSLCLALALHAHFAGEVRPPAGIEADGFAAAAAFARELLCGAAIGFVAALPFDAARMGGRFLDTFRGANAEAALPATGSREAATGDLLHQLLCALVFAGPLHRMVAAALLASFRAAPLGLPASIDSGALVEVALLRATSALATGLAIGAPAAAAALLIDVALGVAARAAPALNLAALGAPAKLLLGGGAILFALGSISNRLLAEVADSAQAANAAVRSFGSLP
jgi:flagellar biosynthetic protein FliR/type III secretion protein T